MAHQPLQIRSAWAFPAWLGSYLGGTSADANTLLDDRSAIHFLLAWSIFEGTFFHQRVSQKQIEHFSAAHKLSGPILEEAANHFHDRYQDKTHYDHLMHTTSSAAFDAVLSKPRTALTQDEVLLLVAFVVYRYRNNMFHGNKRVHTWLDFKPQINLCVAVMQHLLTAHLVTQAKAS